jgi:hypothetical protein
VRRYALIALGLLLISSVAAVRLSAHDRPQLVPGALLAGGGGGVVEAVGSASAAALPRVMRTKVRMARLAPPGTRTTFGRALHNKLPRERGSDVSKFSVVLPKGIEPRVARRSSSRGAPYVAARINGLSSNQGSADPPDVQVAAGPTAIVEMVNAAYSIWSRSGRLLSAGRLASLYSSPGTDRRGDQLTDPRLLFDTRSGRWFSAVVDVTRREALVAVSDSSDPTAGWKATANPFSPDLGGTCPDQPRLGMSDDVVVVTVDLFRTCEGAFEGGVIIAFDKQELLSGGQVTTNTYGGRNTFFSQITPAVSLGATGPEYLISIQRDNPTTALLYTVTDPRAPTVPVRPIRITQMAPPPDAPQRGTIVRLQTGDYRVQNARWENGVLTFVAGDACTPTRVQLACARVTQISTATARLQWERELALGGGRYLFYPVVEPNGAGTLTVAFGYSSRTEYPGIGALTLRPNGHPSPWRVVKHGTAPHVSDRYVPRYGDYFGIARDPLVPTRVWAAGEYGNKLQREESWGTTVFALTSTRAG